MSSNTPPSDSTANKGSKSPETASPEAAAQPAAKAADAKTSAKTGTKSQPPAGGSAKDKPSADKAATSSASTPAPAAKAAKSSASSTSPAAPTPTPAPVASAPAAGAAQTGDQPAKPHPWLGGFLLLFLLLLLANGAVNYRLWQDAKPRDQTLATLTAGQSKVEALASELEQVRAQRLELEQRSRATEQELRRQLNEVQRSMAPLPEQMQVLMAAQADLQEKVSGGNNAWRLDAVEQLLLTANERAQLAQDLSGAQQALELADLRLQSLSDPAWVPLRRQIAADIAALRAVPQPDITALSLKLQALSDRVPGATLGRPRRT